MINTLTPKEIEVCEQFIKSRGVKNCTSIIAKEMFVEISTIKTHIENIYHKLLVNNQAELMYILLTNYSQLANCQKRLLELL